MAELGSLKAKARSSFSVFVGSESPQRDITVACVQYSYNQGKDPPFRTTEQARDTTPPMWASDMAEVSGTSVQITISSVSAQMYHNK